MPNAVPRRAVILAALLSLGVHGAGAGLPTSVRPALGQGPLAGNGRGLASSLDAGAPDEKVSLLVSLEGPTLSELYEASRSSAGGGGANSPPAVGSIGGDGTNLLPAAVSAGPKVTEPPAAALQPLPGSTVTSLREAIARRQAPLRRLVEASGAEVIDAYQVVANGFLAHAAAGAAPAIARLPGVSSVARLPRLRPELAESVPHIGASRVNLALGYDGRGTTVATIDGGIDYSHATFGGVGTESAFLANDENILEPGTFPTAKVIGGYDFAGERYSPDCARLPVPFPQCDSEPHPDDDPLEPRQLSHGSPVAAVIAGEGSTFVHPGVAPGARLVALKVFGNPIGAPPTTDLAIGALEWIVAHNLGLAVPGTAPADKIDVANLSLGFPWATGLPAVDAAIAAAVNAGVTVVASAGDSGPIPYVASQPGAAEMALSVASAYPPGRGEKAKGLRADWVVDGQPASLKTSMLEADFTPSLHVSGPITEPLAWYGLACDDEQGNHPPPAQDVSRRVALIERGVCTFYEKLQNAAELGARAAVVYTDDRDMTVMACEPPSDCAHPPPIPAVMIDHVPGLKLRQVLEAGPVVTVTLNARLEVEIQNLTDVASPFSSRGPSRAGLLKPQITAPGSSIFSALAGGGEQGIARGGTSLAAPFVSGVAALIVQRNAEQDFGLDAADIAAVIMNNADPVVRLGDGDRGALAAVTRQGAGRLNAWRSAVGTTVVRSDSGMAELGFGQLHLLSGEVNVRRELSVRNLAATTRTYRAAARFAFPDEDAGHGVSVAIQPAEITLPAGQVGRLQVDLIVDPAALRPWDLRGFDAIADESAIQELEVDGFVQVTPLDEAGQPIAAELASVPFHVLARQHACVELTPGGPLIFTRQGQTRRLTWDNDCLAAGTVEAFTLLGTDPSESADDPSFPAGLDIEAVGVRYDAEDRLAEGQLLEWAIHTRGPHRLPLEAEFYIFLDLDRDGGFDRVVFNRLGRYIINMPALANRWLVAQAPLLAGTLRPDFDAVAEPVFAQRFDLDETTTTLQVKAASLGLDLSAGDASFGFAVAAMDNSGDYPLTGSFPGQDLAPDGLARGEVFTFDQTASACLTLTGGGAEAAAIPLGGLEIPPGARHDLSIRLTCEPTPAHEPAGLLLSYPANLPGANQVDVRHWRAAGLGSPLFLPYSRRD